MARKPRRFQDMLNEAGDFVLDAGQYGPPSENVAPAEHKRGRGRPRVYIRADIIQVLQWYRANEPFSLEAFHASLQNWLGVKQTPSLKSIHRWLNELPRKPQP